MKKRYKRAGSAWAILLTLLVWWHTSPAEALEGWATNGLSETSTPVVINQLNRAAATAPQVYIVSPRPEEVIADTTVAVQLQVNGTPIFKNAQLGLGPHLHLLLDRVPTESIYDLNNPITLSNLTPGTHTLQVLANKPWHESWKNPQAFAQVTFHVLAKSTDSPNAQIPQLISVQPQEVGAEPWLLDFYVANAPSHIDAQHPLRSIADWRVRATVNDQSFEVSRDEPLYLRGLRPGVNVLKLEYLNNQGQVADSALRVVKYLPNGNDGLSRLVRNELSIDQALTLFDPQSQYSAVGVTGNGLDQSDRSSVGIPSTQQPTGQWNQVVPSMPQGNSVIQNNPGMQTNSGMRGNPGTYDNPGTYGNSGNQNNPGMYSNSGNLNNPGTYGNSGNLNNPGAYGNSGNQNNPGAYGNSGNLNNPGAYGNSGNQNNPGTYGNSGTQSNPGTYGNSGNQSNPGTYGNSGNQSNPGTYGNSGNQNNPGTYGSSGTQNNPGAYGNSGNQNNPGAYGNSGNQSNPGAYGNSGNQSNPGTYGNSGTQNNPGTYGNSGTQNNPGTYGNSGTQNNPGIYSNSGTQNNPGTYGNSGTQNNPGIYGNLGTQNNPGIYGNSGTQKNSGIYGNSGTQNNPGIYGNSGLQRNSINPISPRSTFPAPSKTFSNSAEMTQPKRSQPIAESNNKSIAKGANETIASLPSKNPEPKEITANPQNLPPNLPSKDIALLTPVQNPPTSPNPRATEPKEPIVALAPPVTNQPQKPTAATTPKVLPTNPPAPKSSTVPSLSNDKIISDTSKTIAPLSPKAIAKVDPPSLPPATSDKVADFKAIGQELWHNTSAKIKKITNQVPPLAKSWSEKFRHWLSDRMTAMRPNPNPTTSAESAQPTPVRK
jgi:hypothetical protein